MRWYVGLTVVFALLTVADLVALALTWQSLVTEPTHEEDRRFPPSYSAQALAPSGQVDGAPPSTLSRGTPVAMDYLSFSFERLDAEWLVHVTPSIRNQGTKARTVLCRYFLPIGSEPDSGRLGPDSDLSWRYRLHGANVDVFEGRCTQEPAAHPEDVNSSQGTAVDFTVPDGVVESLGLGRSALRFSVYGFPTYMPKTTSTATADRDRQEQREWDAVGLPGEQVKIPTVLYEVDTGDLDITEASVPSDDQVRRRDDRVLEAESAEASGAVFVAMTDDAPLQRRQALLAVFGFLLGVLLERTLLMSARALRSGRPPPSFPADPLPRHQRPIAALARSRRRASQIPKRRRSGSC